jgi:hypothetical protein
MKKKCLIYYTDNRLEEPIFSTVQQQLSKSGLPIVSVSLRPINFGDNFVLDLQPSYLTMMKQIITALENSIGDYVFFCEHDVLYPLSHFDFIPARDNIFYYNDNVWRWDYPKDRLITYNRLMSLSSLCANRQFVLNHYRARLEIIEENGWDKDMRHEPDWARKWGYELGTKKRKRGGFTDDDFETWKSEHPIVDIRHNRTFSKPKVTLDSFKHLPINWRETTLDGIQGWDLRRLFKL